MISPSRKSQGMPINVIIIATLALIVLVVLVMFFSGRIGSIGKDLDRCETKQAKCQTSPCGDNQAQVSGKCEDISKPNCCATITVPK